MNIVQERHGIDLVVETRDKVFFGRFDGKVNDLLLLKDVLEEEIGEGLEREELIKGLARHGFAREAEFKAVVQAEILRIRRLDQLADD